MVLLKKKMKEIRRHQLENFLWSIFIIVLIKKTNLRCEKLLRHDYKYDYLLPIKYNWNKTKIGNGSAIFIHLTKNYKPTAGCIGLSEKDFLILIKLINKNTKIRIL